MRTHRHKEGYITHQGLSGDEGLGGIVLWEILNVYDGLMGAANHHGICIPMLTNLHVLHMYPRS